MELLVTVASANRKLGKTLVRTSSQTEELEDMCKKAGSHGEPFDLMIVCFVDESPDHYVEIPNKDNVYQVEVGYSPELTFAFGKGAEVLHEVVARMRTVLERAPLHEKTRSKLSKATTKWEKTIPADNDAT